MEIMMVLLILTVITESILSGRWAGFYFLYGLTLFKKSFTFAGDPHLSAEELSQDFSQGISTPIVFHELDQDTIGFREKMFSFRLFNYTPIMHGLIRIDRIHREMSVTGYANWSPIVFAIVFLSTFLRMSLEKEGLGFFILFFFAMLGVLYAIQFSRFIKIFAQVKERSLQHRQVYGQAKTVAAEKKNAKITVAIIAVAIAVFIISSIVWFSPTAKTIKLLSSAQANKFLYSQSGHIRFSADPEYPVYVSVREVKNGITSTKPEQTVVITSGDQYTIQVDLAPGEYETTSSLNSKEVCCGDEKYWGAYGTHIYIKNDGTAKIEEHEIVHYIKMTILSPVSKSVVSDKRPILRWQPVPDANQYSVSWSCDKPRCFGRSVVTTEQYTFEKDVEPLTLYRWNVDAYNKAGDKIAYYSEPTFQTTK